MSEPEPQLAPIPRSLYWIMTIQYAVGGAILPFISLYFGDRGLTYDEISWIFLASSAIGAVLPVVWGYLGDRWIRLPRLLTVLHLAAAGIVLLLDRQSTFPMLLSCYATFAGLYMPTAPLVSALSYHHLPRPELQFGKLRLWGSMGWMLPSLPVYLWLALYSTGPGGSLSFCVYLTSGIGLLMTVLLLANPRLHEARAPLAQAVEPLPYAQALRLVLRRRGFLALVVVILLAHASFAILSFYSGLLLEHVGFERRWIGPLQCLGVVCELPFLSILPVVIRRLGYRKTIALGCGTLLVRQIIYAVPSPPWLLASSYVLAGACVAFYLTGASLALNSMADRSVRATVQTLVTLAGSGLGQMLGHRIAGALAGSDPTRLPRAFEAAAWAAGAAVLILLVFLKDRDLLPVERPQGLAG